MCNKKLGRTSTSQDESLDGLSAEQYDSRKATASDIQALNTILFYDLTRQKIITATSIFADNVSNYDLLVHSIASLYLQTTITHTMHLHYSQKYESISKKGLWG